MYGGAYFVETSHIFGHKISPPNYDSFHEIVCDIVNVKCENHPNNGGRALDDNIAIHISLEEHLQYTNTYIDLAKFINLPLQDFKSGDKAFLNRKQEIALGIFFDLEKQTWMYPEEKRYKILRTIDNVLNQSKVSLKEMRKLVGLINSFAILCPILKFLKASVLNDQKWAIEHNLITFDDQMVQDLKTWFNLIQQNASGFPIAQEIVFPPLFTVKLYTDAAGPVFYRYKGIKKVNRSITGMGAGAVCFDHNDKMIFAVSCPWPTTFFFDKIDQFGKSFGQKSCLLETIAILLPILHYKHVFQNQYVEIFTDNLGVVFAFQKGRSKTDPYTTIMIRLLKIIEASLPCKFFVNHIKRMSSDYAVLADQLSRSDNDTFEKFQCNKLSLLPYVLEFWTNNPTLNWNLHKLVF